MICCNHHAVQILDEGNLQLYGGAENMNNAIYMPRLSTEVVE